MKFIPRVTRRFRARSFSQACAFLCGLHLAEAQQFQITDTSIDGLGRFTVSHVAAADSYYLLYRGDSPTNFPQVAALKLGQDGFGQLTDPATVNNVTAAFYRVLRVPLTQSLDVDGDGIPDVYELQHPAFLNPLNPGDAGLDYDGDGKSNLQEFRDGTDPAKLPDNPAAVASPIDPSRSTSVADATTFLYTGPNAIQSGVTNGTFDPLRVCVLRGRVRQRDGSILTGVTISVLRHSEFGLTKTRADGMFDLAVNGGELLTVIFTRPGYCPVQRQLQTPWADYLCLDDVTMMTMDPTATPVAFGTNSPAQVARGSISTDTDGSRQATLILPSGTCANVIINGTTQSCGALTLRATEFTVGTNGPASMPAGLPPTSGYTYCVELSADEAVAVGASTVQFNQPLCFYVENFLNFPVGQIVPTGYYDRQKGTWVASRNGRVIKVLDVINGAATIDADGDGAADTAAQLAALGITDEELQRVAALYSPGQTLWRTCITHFSPWDLNTPEGPPPGSKSPPSASNGPNMDKSNQSCGSIIEVERQTLGESLDIVGTPYRLHYHSDRARGYLQAYTIRIPLSEDTVPASLKRVDLKIEVAGRLFSQSYPAAPNQYATFTWDGLDAYGRVLSGTFPISVHVGFVYPATYYPPGQFEQSFAGFPNTTFAINNARGEITLWKDWKGITGNLLADTVGLGNWTIDVHHAYDPRSRTLHFGNGNRRSATALDLTVISTFAGGAFASANNGDGGPATAARLTVTSGLVVAPDGSLYIAEDVGNRVRKVGP
ncbi:MAG TPA: hypothetical protein VLU94_00350, partial [Candidatus Nitrosotalea sp.]|nr:hypothetical protein [Candidatus Nitrosotalea sp.]